MENKSLPMSVRRYAGKIVERREKGFAVREDEIASISGLTWYGVIFYYLGAIELQKKNKLGSYHGGGIRLLHPIGLVCFVLGVFMCMFVDENIVDLYKHNFVLI